MVEDNPYKKNMLYFAQLAERKYAALYRGESVAPKKFVVVDVESEYCMLTEEVFRLTVTQLEFRCEKKGGVVVTEFVRDGHSRMESALGLYNPHKMKKVSGKPIGDDEHGCVIELPERMRGVHPDVFKVKITNLDDLVESVNFAGWGDYFADNVLEIIGSMVNMIRTDAPHPLIDFKQNKVVPRTAVLVKRNGDDTYTWADFTFSHFEVDDNDEDENVIYLCYRYWGTINKSVEELQSGKPID